MVTVLLAMNPGSLRSSLVWQLRQAGFAVDVTASGAQALDWLAVAPPEALAVLDLPEHANSAVIGCLADDPLIAARHRLLVCLDADAPDLPPGMVQPPITVLRRPLSLERIVAAVQAAAINLTVATG